MKTKLSAVFLLAVLAIAAVPAAALGVSFETVSIGLALVAGATLFVESGGTFRPTMMHQRGDVGDVEAQYKQVQEDLKKVSDQLKQHGENAKAEIEKHQTMSQETRAKVDELLVKQGELQANLQGVEQVIAKLETGGGNTARPKTVGQQYTDSEEFQARAGILARGGKGSISVDVQAAITSDAASAGDIIEPMRVPGIVATPNQRLFIRDLIPFGPTASNSVEYVKETGFTNSADVVSENPQEGKPESDITFDAASAPVATVAHWLHATKQVLSDAGMLQSYIDGRLRYGLKLKEEGQLLKGSGVGLNIDGIYTQASAYANPGVNAQAETIIDRLRLALLQVELAEYSGDGIVLNPVDWAAIELTKTSENAYLMANPRGMMGPVLWGRPVVPTKSLSVDEFLVGAFQMGAQGWDRENVTVTVSTEDRDNFIKNMVTILCEERVGLTVFRPEAFVKGDLSDLTTSGS